MEQQANPQQQQEEGVDRTSQQNLNFPAKPEEINRDMLTPLNAVTTDDIERRMQEELE